MADTSITTDYSKMKVVDLKKELKTRGLPISGDKSELVARLQEAETSEQADISLDSDEMDSEGVLEDDDDEKTHDDSILDDVIVDETLNEKVHNIEPVAASPEGAAPKSKIKIKRKSEDLSKAVAAKKILLNRPASVTAPEAKTTEDPAPKASPIVEVEGKNLATDNTLKMKVDLDAKARLELRAKRFGTAGSNTVTSKKEVATSKTETTVPIDSTEVMTEEQRRKEARRIRFGASDVSQASGTNGTAIDKLKQRAERFGQSVSKVMTDIENKERLEKRRSKFGVVN